MFNRKHMYCTSAALLLALGAATNASATESGFYIGANYGQSMFDVDDGELGVFDITTSSSTDDKDTAWSLAMGYRFNPYIALELSYLDLGQVTINETGRDISPAFTGRVNASVGAKGAVAAIIGTIPVNKFEFFGKLGMFAANTEIEANVTLTLGTTTQSGSDSTDADSTETVAGLGVGYSFTDNFYVKFEWMNIPEVGDEEETGEADTGLLSVGFQYRF